MGAEQKGRRVVPISEGRGSTPRLEFSLPEQNLLNFLAGYPVDILDFEDIVRDRARFFIHSQGVDNKRRHVIVLEQRMVDENGALSASLYYPKVRRELFAPRDIERAHQRIREIKDTARHIVAAKKKEESQTALPKKAKEKAG